mmetsp:Transcript_29452/g.61678  ORF Transcript_29452/g.61678 Transcript_29452/m.61678 type:complete len:939 (-) Transcript_29452:64-2880(-)
MRNNDHASGVVLDGSCQGSEGVAIEEVGGLVENSDVRLHPHARREHDLNLLPARKRRDLGVGPELSLKVEAVQVLLNVELGQLLCRDATRLEGDALIHLHHQLLQRWPDVVLRPLLVAVVSPLHAQKRVLCHPRVVVNRVLAADELHLVLVSFLSLTPRAQLLDLADLLPNQLLLILRELEEVLGLALAVHAAREAPLEVADWRLLEVVLNVVESVLSDVREAHVRVARDLAPALALVRLELADKHLDHGGLAGSVDANDGDTRRHGDLDGDVVQRVSVAGRVAVRAVDHLHERLGLGGDTLKHARVGEREGDVLALEAVVSRRLGDQLHELRKVALVHLELAVLLVVNAILGDVVKEDGVVRHDHGGDLLLREILDVLGQPRDAVHVDMVGRLVEQQQLGLLEHGAGERQAHAPATRERTDRAVDEDVSEGARAHHVDDLLLGLLNQERVLLDELPANLVRVSRGHIALHVDGADLLGEALDEVRRDGAHERGLTRTVGSDQTVALATLELEVRVVQQHAVTVCERKLAVAEDLQVVVVLLDLLLLAGTKLLRGDLEELLAKDDGLRLRDGRAQVRNDHLGLAGAALGEQRCGDLGDPLGDLVRLVRVSGENLGQDGLHLNGRAVDFGRLEGAESNLHGVERLAALLTDFGHRDLLRALRKLGNQLGSEVSDVGWVVDQLEHGVDDDGGLAHHVHIALDAQATEEDRHDDGKGGLVDGSDVGGRHELVEAGLALGVRVQVGRDDGVNKRVNVGVVNDGAALLEGLASGLLDGWLGVLRDLHQLVDDGGQGGGDGLGGVLGKLSEHVHGAELGLPAVLGEGFEEKGKHAVDGDGVERGHHGGAGCLGLELHAALLVGEEGAQRGEDGDEVGLDPEDARGLGPGGKVDDGLHRGLLGILIVSCLGNGGDDSLGGSLVGLLEERLGGLGPREIFRKLGHL